MVLGCCCWRDQSVIHEIHGFLSRDLKILSRLQVGRIQHGHAAHGLRSRHGSRQVAWLAAPHVRRAAHRAGRSETQIQKLQSQEECTTRRTICRGIGFRSKPETPKYCHWAGFRSKPETPKYCRGIGFRSKPDTPKYCRGIGFRSKPETPKYCRGIGFRSKPEIPKP